jgi:hypothetical protein
MFFFMAAGPGGFPKAAGYNGKRRLKASLALAGTRPAL